MEFKEHKRDTKQKIRAQYKICKTCIKMECQMKGHSTSFWYGKTPGERILLRKILFFETLKVYDCQSWQGRYLDILKTARHLYRNLLPSAPTIDMAPWLLSKCQARTWGFNMDKLITKVLNMKNTLKHIEATHSFNSFIPGNHLRKTVFFPHSAGLCG